MEGRKVLALPRRKLFQIASRLMGIIALDEDIILRRMTLEGIKVVKENGWYRLSWTGETLVRRVGGKIGDDALEVLLRCYLLLKGGEEKEEGGREAA